jgi:hypothetical protein
VSQLIEKRRFGETVVAFWWGSQASTSRLGVALVVTDALRVLWPKHGARKQQRSHGRVVASLDRKRPGARRPGRRRGPRAEAFLMRIGPVKRTCIRQRPLWADRRLLVESRGPQSPRITPVMSRSRKDDWCVSRSRRSNDAGLINPANRIGRRCPPLSESISLAAYAMRAVMSRQLRTFSTRSSACSSSDWTPRIQWSNCAAPVRTAAARVRSPGAAIARIHLRISVRFEPLACANLSRST